MINTVFSLFEVLKQCAGPKWNKDAILVVCWDGPAMVKAASIDSFSLEDGVSQNEPAAYADIASGIIYTTASLAFYPIGKIIFILAHELAHTSGYPDELDADTQAFKLIQTLNKNRIWKETGIKIYIRSKPIKGMLLSDRITTIPYRLPVYYPPWEVNWPDRAEQEQSS